MGLEGIFIPPWAETGPLLTASLPDSKIFVTLSFADEPNQEITSKRKDR